VKGFQDLRLTARNQMIGTLQYLAPEVVRGAAFSFSSDLYSLALVILECLSGKPVFPRDNDYLVMDAVAKGSAPTLDTILKDRIQELPPILVSVLSRLTAFHPKKRFQCAQDVLECLEKIPEDSIKAENPEDNDFQDHVHNNHND
jgi:serine/threonine protein kinase